jgi:hypothetical protein
VRQSFRPLDLSGFRGDEVLSQLDSDMQQTPLLTVHGDGVVRRIAD